MLAFLTHLVALSFVSLRSRANSKVNARSGIRLKPYTEDVADGQLDDPNVFLEEDKFPHHGAGPILPQSMKFVQEAAGTPRHDLDPMDPFVIPMRKTDAAEEIRRYNVRASAEDTYHSRGIEFEKAFEHMRPLPKRNGVSHSHGTSIACQPLAVNTERVVSFEYDCGGFDNVRTGFEIALALSVIANRTLVIPPKLYHTNFAFGNLCREHGCSVLDYFDFETLRTQFSVIKAEDYDPIITKRGPEAAYASFKKRMRLKNKLADVRERLNTVDYDWDDISEELDENHNDDAVWHWHENCPHVRLYGQLEGYFRDHPKLRDIQQRLFHGLRFRDELIDTAIERLKRMNVGKCGDYCAVHLRMGAAWDHMLRQDLSQYMPQLLSGAYLNHIKEVCPDHNAPLLLLMADDLKDNSLFDQMHLAYPKMTFASKEHEFDSEVKEPLNSVTDFLAGACARNFIGTAESTFTGEILILRGYLGGLFNRRFADEDDKLIDTTVHFTAKHKETEEGLLHLRGDVPIRRQGAWNEVFEDRWMNVHVRKPAC